MEKEIEDGKKRLHIVINDEKQEMGGRTVERPERDKVWEEEEEDKKEFRQK